METQQLINTIDSLTHSIDALNRAGQVDAINVIVKRLLLLIEVLSSGFTAYKES